MTETTHTAWRRETFREQRDPFFSVFFCSIRQPYIAFKLPRRDKATPLRLWNFSDLRRLGCVTSAHLEWPVWSSSSGNKCHAVHRSLSSGASLKWDLHLVPYYQPSTPARFLSIIGHWDVSHPLSSGLQVWSSSSGNNYHAVHRSISSGASPFFTAQWEFLPCLILWAKLYFTLVSHRQDIKAVTKAVAEYERIAGAKVNFDKSEGLRFAAWTGSNTLPQPFHWSDGPVCILGVWFGSDLQLERNWSEVPAKVDAQVEIWSFTGWLYFFGLRHVGWRFNAPSPDYWPMVSRQVCIQRTCNGGLDMPDLVSR